jgi:replicative DNA helicase
MSSTDPWLQKVPPHNLDAEQSILSAILIDNNTLPEVLEVLSQKDFYRDAHAKIFKAMEELFERNEPVDLITLANLLKERGALEAIGGASYLAALVDTVPMATNASHYAKIIQEKATLRRLIERAASIATRCLDDKGNVDEILDFAEQSIFEISENKVKPSFYALKDILTDTYKAVEDAYENKAMVTGVPTGFKDLDKITAGFQPGKQPWLSIWPRMPVNKARTR